MYKEMKCLSLETKYPFAAIRNFSQDDTCVALGILPLVTNDGMPKRDGERKRNRQDRERED